MLSDVCSLILRNKLLFTNFRCHHRQLYSCLVINLPYRLNLSFFGNRSVTYITCSSISTKYSARYSPIRSRYMGGVPLPSTLSISHFERGLKGFSSSSLRCFTMFLARFLSRLSRYFWASDDISSLNCMTKILQFVRLKPTYRSWDGRYLLSASADSSMSYIKIARLIHDEKGSHAPGGEQEQRHRCHAGCHAEEGSACAGLRGQEAIIAYVKKHGFIRRAEAQELLGVNEARARYLLQKMQKAGHLRKIT